MIYSVNMFAVVETGGKQYMVKAGDVIKTEKILGDVGDTIQLTSVLLSDLGDNCTVRAKILEQKKTDKVIVFKKIRRHNYRRKKGHRQQITVMRIEKIV